MSTFSYFELHTPDLQAARAFYGALFGWKFEELQFPGGTYVTIDTGGGGGGMMHPPPKAPPMWLNYITVDDLDASAKRVLALGGRILTERTEVKGKGFFAVVADPGGAPFALWQVA